jgi:hypothetical protein
MTESREDYYPKIAIKTCAAIEQSEQGFRWVMSVHIEGPDDIAMKEGPWLKNRRDATEDMLRQYDRVMGKLHKEFA